MTSISGLTSTNPPAKKRSASEVGHAKNLANFNLLAAHVQALGSLYNPSSPTLDPANLQDLYNTTHNYHQEVADASAPYTFAVDDREAIFGPLNHHLTRLRKAYKTTEGVTPAHLEDFMAIARKIKGKRSPVTTTVPANPEQGLHQHSVSQLSYDQRTSNMGLLIALLQNTPNFAPNEAEYTIAFQQEKKAMMLARTQAVANTYITLNTARSLRNDALYHAPFNLVDVGNKVKDYVGTILEKNDPRYKAIAAIKFRKD